MVIATDLQYLNDEENADARKNKFLTFNIDKAL